MKKSLLYFLLFFIVVMSFALRFYDISQNPPALNWDEVSIGYNAYSILKTGKDEWGKSFPVHFKSYGEYKLPGQIYLSIPGIYLFGLNELGVRITPIVYGTLTVLVIFFLGKELFANKLVGLTAAFLLGISPWHIQLTRGSFESSLATLFVSVGIWFLVKGFKDQKWFLYSTIPFALSVFTYNTARIFTPLFLIFVLIAYRNQLVNFKKIIIASLVLFIILMLPLVPYLLSGERSARYKLVSITDDPGLVPRINENRGNSKFPYPISRYIHNKVTYVSFYFARNYLSHFSPEFLLISGAPHKQHHVQGMGQLYFFQGPFLILGLINLFYLKNKFRSLLIGWLLLSYIPVSATNDSIPHALRTLIAAPYYQLVSGLGFVVFMNWLRNKLFLIRTAVLVFFCVVIVFSLGKYVDQYYNVYPVSYSKDWQYGYKQAVDFIKSHYHEYDQIIFTRHYGEPHMFTLFYLNFDPQKYQTDSNLIRFETFDWVRVLKFDKFYFPDLGDEETKFADIVNQNPDKRLMFIGKAEDFPINHQRLKTIKFLNGESAFDIVETK